MLAHILAIAVGISSLALYITAFFSPKLHRKDDFLWSGIGLFYALALWVCAGRITGGVLLGQLAGVSLLIWFGAETIKLRKAIAYPELRQEIENFSLIDWVQQKSSNLFKKRAIPAKVPQDTTAVTPEATQAQTAETKIEDKPTNTDLVEVVKIEAETEIQETTAEVITPIEENTVQLTPTPENPPEVITATIIEEVSDVTPIINETESQTEEIETLTPTVKEEEVIEPAKNAVKEDKKQD